MLIDILNYYSNNQVETTIGAHDSTNTINFGDMINGFGETKLANYGSSDQKANHLNFLVSETFTSGGAGTLAFKLQESADNSSWNDTDISISAKALADLEIGDYWTLQLPDTLKKYTKVVYTIAVADMLTGKMKAWIGERYIKRVQSAR